MFLATTPAPEAIRRKAVEVIARPEYQLERGLDDASESLWVTLISWMLKPFIWLLEMLDGLPMPLRVLVMIVLTIVLVILCVHIVWTLISALRSRTGRDLPGAVNRDQSIDPEDLEAAAQRAGENGEHLEAVRLLFRAALLRIEQAEEKKFRIGITNRELLRRYGRSALRDPLELLVETIDRKWYGGEVCELDDYLQCREEHGRIRTLTQRGADALRA